MEGRILDWQLLETEDGGEEPGRASGRNATLGTGCLDPFNLSCLPLLPETSLLIMRTLLRYGFPDVSQHCDHALGQE